MTQRPILLATSRTRVASPPRMVPPVAEADAIRNAAAVKVVIALDRKDVEAAWERARAE